MIIDEGRLSEDEDDVIAPSGALPWSGTTSNPVAFTPTAQSDDSSSSDDDYEVDNINKYLITEPIVNHELILPYVVHTAVDVTPEQTRKVYVYAHIQMLSGTTAGEFLIKIGKNRRSLIVEDQTGTSKSIFYSDVIWNELQDEHISKQVRAAFNRATAGFMEPPKQMMIIRSSTKNHIQGCMESKLL